ncbi:efflux RND transporter periplasmic adaptor subunit [Salinisphaera sp. P385]|uniref:Efflux RND transporter periplasmic adaptor subunit n=1 Tax=Spectribacter acetivorans TaxID=3075603 RepID=A0ABU3B852_9GAMM|nr:efflux RND transporter periplasmic adaptor subunit [Salinisphaera sp. P385]MDT0617473.1 efflux RND transporter periplasmic adaptor subunit [Salinisphaera sp. P385]
MATAIKSAAINPVISMALLLALTACGPAPQDNGEHAQDGKHGDERPTRVFTHFTEQSELFVEFPALAAGQDSRFAAHVTRLADYRPVREGRLSVLLTQGGKSRARFVVEAPARPGIFTPVVRPREPGVYRLSLRVDAPDLQATHELGEVTVYADAHAAKPAPEEAGGAISYLKEQQWQAEFGTEAVTERRLRASVYATAELRPPGDRTARVRAPAEGLFAAYGEQFPVIGAEVDKGQRLGTLRARLAGGVDLSSLRLAVERTRAEYRLARENLERLRGLLDDGAVAAHRVREAENAAAVARAEYNAAKARLDQYQGGDEDTGVPVIAPIAGRIVAVSVAPGAFVSPDQELMQIAGGDKRWLEARIPEADADRLRQPTGAWFKLGGQRRVLRVGENARLITAGGVIDPVSRTVPVIFEFTETDTTPLLNQGLDARVYTGETVEALAVPRSAIIDDSGQPVVYVQTGGETFARRPVQLGLRGADYVAVTSGLQAGDRVVTRGAYQVRLAAAAPAEAGHGHAH